MTQGSEYGIFQNKLTPVLLFSETSTQVGFDNSGKYLLSAGDKHVHVFHNITGKCFSLYNCLC